MRGYVESDSVVQIFCTSEETDEEFMKYELFEVMSAKVNLNYWLKRTRGARSESPEAWIFREFVSRGFGKLRSQSHEVMGTIDLWIYVGPYKPLDLKTE
jgi:hypothetical protein